MSVRFRVELAPGAPRGHEVVVGRGLERELTELLRELAPSGLFVVSDRNVAGLHLPALEAALREGGFAAAPACVLEPGEGSKSPAALVRLWEALLAAGLDRGGVVLALGGGVVGDVAGFAAATWLRGVRVVHLPTTLLAMIDSALGGKTALDLGGAKNQVGAFHPPAGLVADLERLCTLPARERAAGLGEAWKTALLAGEPLLSRAEASAAGARAGDLDALAPLVEGCLRHKAAVVAADERDERGLRALLNLGHTVGHALEAARPALLHGEAVAIGVHVALRLSERLGRAEPGFVPRALTLGHALGLTLAPDRPLELDELRPWLARDKKRGAAGLQWVLPRGPGRAELATADEASVQGALLDVLLRSGAARPR